MASFVYHCCFCNENRFVASGHPYTIYYCREDRRFYTTGPSIDVPWLKLRRTRRYDLKLASGGSRGSICKPCYDKTDWQPHTHISCSLCHFQFPLDTSSYSEAKGCVGIFYKSTVSRVRDGVACSETDQSVPCVLSVLAYGAEPKHSYWTFNVMSTALEIDLRSRLKKNNDNRKELICDACWLPWLDEGKLMEPLNEIERN